MDVGQLIALLGVGFVNLAISAGVFFRLGSMSSRLDALERMVFGGGTGKGKADGLASQAAL